MPTGIRLLVMAVLAAFSCHTPASAQSPPANQPGFTLEWRKAVPPLRDIAISAQGTRLALLTADDKLAVWDSIAPNPLWSRPNIDGTDVAISDGVGYVVVYDLMNPVERDVQLYTAATGGPVSRLHPDAAVWDLAISESGDFLCYGTGAGSLYICTLDMAPSIHRVALRGVCNGVDISADGTFAATGLWNASGVDWFDMKGNTLSSQTGDASQRFEPLISRDGRFILGLQYENHQHRNPILTLWRKDGSTLWTYAIGKHVSNARALVSANGSFVVASYYDEIQRDSTWTPERRLVLLDSRGKPAFRPFGGRYLSLTLMFLSPDNNGFVAYDGDRTLYRFDKAGNAIRTWPLTSPIRVWTVTGDNQRLIVHTTDNQLASLRVR